MWSSTESFTVGSMEQMCSCGLRTEKLQRLLEISSAVNSCLPVTVKLTVSASSSLTSLLKRTCLRLRMMSTTLSMTPGIVSNS